ncbi:hypothetical protein F3Y22_tig00112225pilonHSYRG00015 [Hibiscus syriacus]|uniref:Chaperone DnaJ C-terminal domain-containing protein n=1 Tax=Hibiscus syriacus TaxID=106335 RepID=A0A6A2YCV2_HIBSY|nr:hypothetical protein F3Y22_tig00112225pilonHSYRG00015 [Hibiscus syriacus]
MGDRDQSHHHRDHERPRPAADLYGIIGKSCKAYKLSIVNKWQSDHKLSPKNNQDDSKFKDDDSDQTAIKKVKEEKSKKGGKPSKRDKKESLSMDESVFFSPIFTSNEEFEQEKKARQKQKTVPEVQVGKTHQIQNPFEKYESESRSRKHSEELCFRAVKRINIVKDVISKEGIIVKQEETLTINIKPGWTKGTKVTFDGKGDEKPGYLPADIKFSIQEQRHHLFKRTGDDLEIEVEILLVKALTGCHLAVPLLGGETMSIYVCDIVYPGYVKVIHGQGMPKAKEGNRGDPKITFLVKFPISLTHQQRSEACSLLECS